MAERRRLPKFELGHFPTPLEELQHLTNSLGGPRILIKRDDCTGLALGGNKTRKLEYLLADALASKADVIVTGAGIQSNHVRQTAAAARRGGLSCIGVLQDVLPDQTDPYLRSGNVLIDHLLACKLVPMAQYGENIPQALETLSAQLRAAGQKPYVVPIGGSNGLGSLGYVDAAFEITEQLALSGTKVVAHVVASGSGGTHAGLLLGLRLAGASTSVIGVGVSQSIDVHFERVRRIVDETATILEVDPQAVGDEDIILVDGLQGSIYGEPTVHSRMAVEMLAQCEAILLDHVYTGKAMAALLRLVTQGRWGPSDVVVFWHTGGSPSLFAFYDRVMGECPIRPLDWTA